ncbi:MAG: MotA/TolQ/ExbB proton channel family protein [Fibrobacterota bacterium]
MGKFLTYLIAGFEGHGGFVMWVLCLLAAAGWAIIIERIYYLMFKCGSRRGKFVADMYKIIKTGDYQRAIKFAYSVDTPLAKVMATILQNKDKGEEAMVKAVDEVFLTEKPKIARYTGLLFVIANVATLVGLTGTVFGLIMSFDAVANVPVAQRAQALASGIAVGMTATAFGLFVAIPCLIVQGVLTTVTDRIVEEMEEKSTKMINTLAGEAK